jgi:hypothetical protein
MKHTRLLYCLSNDSKRSKIVKMLLYRYRYSKLSLFRNAHCELGQDLAIARKTVSKQKANQYLYLNCLINFAQVLICYD